MVCSMDAQRYKNTIPKQFNHSRDKILIRFTCILCDSNSLSSVNDHISSIALSHLNHFDCFECLMSMRRIFDMNHPQYDPLACTVQHKLSSKTGISSIFIHGISCMGSRKRILHVCRLSNAPNEKNNNIERWKHQKNAARYNEESTSRWFDSVVLDYVDELEFL